MAKNGALKIEKGIPIPPRRFQGLSTTFRAMKVGDSVVVPKAGSISMTAQRAWGPTSYVARKVEGGYRVWRLK